MKPRLGDPAIIVRRHESWRAGCINLIPSENVMSDAARGLLACDMGHRYSLPRIKEMDDRPVENAYRGTRYLDEVESLAIDLACRVFRCKHACVRPISGHISALIALSSVCSRGDSIMAVEFSDGGYPGYAGNEMAGMLGLDAHGLPFDDKACDLAYDAASEEIVRCRPRAVVLGASKMLFPPDVKRMREACDETDSKLIYDASHVLGLLAGGRFGRPLREGADMVFGSTHKTFFGPQGGIMLTDDLDMFSHIERNLHWKTIDNAHWNRIAALAQALLEMRRFGEAYAEMIVQNAKRLARALDEGGLPVQCREKDYTESHQVGLNGPEVARSLGSGSFQEIAKRLEEADIIIDCVGRLGTPEVTRLGMVGEEMEEIADLIIRALAQRESLRRIRTEVHLLRSRFPRPKFCFEPKRTRLRSGSG